MNIHPSSVVQSGQVLLAEPFMQDPYFQRAVILLCEHWEHGSLGFIINKPLEMKLSDLLADLSDADFEVSYGGPVHTDTLHYLHDLGDIIDDSVKVADGIWMGGDFEQVKALIRNELITPDRIRFFIGYSGWSGGQLNEEIEVRSWVTAAMHPNYLFKSPSSDLWKQVMYNKGDVYEIIADIPEGLNWN
ncbi:MAG: YqgE/AlgH family protein [Saprospiraceae bacterium]|nr:YqgE/AlgH family protein [Saprospiraceae bacterium]